MAVDSKRASGFLALSRFGYGARGSSNDLAHAISDPRAFLKAELEVPGIALLERASLPATKAALQALYAEQERIRLQREERKQAQADAPGKPSDMPAAKEPPSEAMAGQDAPKPAEAKPMRAEPPLPQQLFRADALARFQATAASEVGFVERLVQFWSNHFCVSAAKGGAVRATAGCFEREAIRPHVLGRFADMLRAVAGHPAMLVYLDNAQSFGPTSIAGQRRNRGLNENLAREILELHTLGVGAGYTQADVTSLARILTGWTFAGREGRIGEPGQFTFLPNGHEPGDHALLGNVYKAGGLQQGEAALADLARHPATAKHVARKFAAYFVADEPPAELVERLTRTFEKSGGDLKALALALLESDEAWNGERTKLRSPHEFLMATVRAVGRVPEDPGLLLGPLVVMGMPLWQPPGPNGWPDTVAAWATPKGMKSRLDISAAVAARLKDSLHPAELLEATLGEAASRETRQAVTRAESRQQALALLLMSPEFQWR
jgi:uncharacterized protein (DUF1800 family)